MIDVPFRDPAALEAYCMPFVRGEKQPNTAVELMASRYVAYTVGAVDYLLETHDPKTRSQTDRESISSWSKRATWQGLEILSSEAGGPDDEVGQVEFIARFSTDTGEHAHHERAEFRRVRGRWHFVSGEEITPKVVQAVSTKVGRNEPCPCGSGKKHKKCCGARA